ncbi:hypothetical protein FB567DRAFT_249341 [Paraphoma chrysanthemicola]|uniref:Uncharacterized protein n=1 Tax=Paraphoma chrysanthemicola TaxID=798071 RepID=A0A8K0QS18_9PLEO|nr:hypothetical protein FB567DRAFT_249341 [Paraphoma chrysanthemicola]
MPSSPLQPALQLTKILNHVHIPPSSAATSASEQSGSLDRFDASDGENSGPGSEDEVQYTKARFVHGEETEDGYEDEDGSMELSDRVEEDHNADMTLDGEATWYKSDTIEAFDRRHRSASRRFSPPLLFRRASEDPLPSSSFPYLPSEPSILPSPGGIRLECTSAATIPDTPFARTLKYFKQYAGKENSPSKSRRNASLPDEIAGLLAQRAEELEEEEEEEDLEQYREVDLAPMESIMGNPTAGDLILPNTPAKSWDPNLLEVEGTSPLGVKHAHGTEEKLLNEEVTRIRQPSVVTETEPPKPNILVELDQNDDKKAENSDKTFTKMQSQSTDPIQHPIFVNIIALLPEAMFWAAAAPVAKLGEKAHDAMVEKLSGILTKV